MKTLVLGLGNELYGDDGVGIHVVRKLKQELEPKKKTQPWLEKVDFEECSVSGLALLEVITGYDRLIIIDTIKKLNPITGRVRILEGNELRHIPGPSPHYVSVPQTLEIGQNIGLKVPSEIRIVAVEAKNLYNLGERLTDEMKKAIPVIINKAIEILKK